jgi:hypothetical protein
MIWQKQYIVVPLKGDNAVLQGGAALSFHHGRWMHKKTKERAARKAKNKYAFVTIFSVIILIKLTLVHQHGVVLFSSIFPCLYRFSTSPPPIYPSVWATMALAAAASIPSCHLSVCHRTGKPP